ncbi:cation transporter [Microbacterium aurugineum]|uniref:cation transporter n=1 Tax=Microbacterium aurugineum TaxID=2851642 RepID=UPI0020C141E7|nr:cation transporter [Microbacterium aurugineum]MCK8475705.1 cation transporter [Microbacterium aurugineum]
MEAASPSSSSGSMRTEQHVLRLSMWASIAVTITALVLGVITGTQIIIFDAAFMGIGVILTIASIRTAHITARGPSRRFPFGRNALTPLIVTVQGLAIAGTLVYAAADAVVVIRAGGATASPLLIGVYGIATASLGFALARHFRRRAPRSDLVLAEVAQWKAGAMLSVVMVIGAAAATALISAGLPQVANYVDPALVVLASIILAYIPYRLLAAGLGELLEASPSPALLSRLASAVEHVRVAHRLPEPSIRASKLGRRLYVEVDFEVDGAAWTISAEDEVRRAIVSALSGLDLDVWANVSLTADPTLFE